MDPLAYPIFSLISSAILSGYALIVDNAVDRFSDSIVLVALGIETLYIMHYGFMIVLQKSSEAVPNPSIRDLLYHVVIVVIVLTYIKTDINTLIDLIRALRRMIIEGLTGAMQPSPGTWGGVSFGWSIPLVGGVPITPPIFGALTTPGQKIAADLAFMDAAFSLFHLVNVAPFMKDISAPLQGTAFTLSLIAEVSPQITAGIMLLINELMVKTGIALFPLALYCLLYKVTQRFFDTWFNMMFAASVQMGILIVTVTICVKVTVTFLAALTALTLTQFALASSKVGSYIISDLQESVIQAGFGITLTTLIAWVPGNAANLAGALLTAGTTKSGVGMAMSSRSTTQHQSYKDTLKQTKRDIKNITNKLKSSNNYTYGFKKSNASTSRPNTSATTNSSRPTAGIPNAGMGNNASSTDNLAATTNQPASTSGSTASTSGQRPAARNSSEGLRNYLTKYGYIKEGASKEELQAGYDKYQSLEKKNNENANKFYKEREQAYSRLRKELGLKDGASNKEVRVEYNKFVKNNINKPSNTSSSSVSTSNSSPKPSNSTPSISTRRAVSWVIDMGGASSSSTPSTRSSTPNTGSSGASNGSQKPTIRTPRADTRNFLKKRGYIHESASDKEVQVAYDRYLSQSKKNQKSVKQPANTSTPGSGTRKFLISRGYIKEGASKEELQAGYDKYQSLEKKNNENANKFYKEREQAYSRLRKELGLKDGASNKEVRVEYNKFVKNNKPTLSASGSGTRSAWSQERGKFPAEEERPSTPPPPRSRRPGEGSSKDHN